MENINIKGTLKTPSIICNSNGHLEITGRSIPENSVQFYLPLLQWLDEYFNNPQPTTVVDMKLEYFNTSSSKSIYDMFKKLIALKESGHEVLVKWYYESDDDDMRETGEDYQLMTKLPFEMISVDELFPGITG